MAWMARVMVWLALALTAGLIASYAWGRLRPPTEVQAKALALLQSAPAPVNGFNAWATFWLLDYDVPADQVETVYAAEREHLDDWAQHARKDDGSHEPYASRVAEHFPKRPALSDAQRKQLCFPNDADCLAKVRANLPSLRELLGAQASRVAQLRAIPPDAVLWDDTPRVTETPLPPLGGIGNLRLTAAALDFADGKPVQALAQTCRDARTVRHLRAHTNSVLGAVVANSWMDAIEKLLAGMLRELPPDQPIPSDCATAFAPVTRADVDMCAARQADYQGLRTVLDNVIPARLRGVRRLPSQLLFDSTHSQWLTAPAYAWACDPAVADGVLADHRTPSIQAPGARYDSFDVLSNPVGVNLARIAVKGPDRYLTRNEDYAAGLRAMAWLLANRASATTPDSWRRQLAAARPVLQQKGSRQFHLSPDGDRLIVPYREQRPHHQELVLPLSR